MITSSRLLFRKFTKADFSDYFTLVSNEELMKFITGRGLTEDEAQHRFSLNLSSGGENEELGFFMAYSKNTQELIGMTKVTILAPGEIEVGYSVLPEHWRSGYGTEMLDALMAFAKEFPDIEKLVGITDQKNVFSQKLLLNAGFMYVGRELAQIDSSNVYKKVVKVVSESEV